MSKARAVITENVLLKYQKVTIAAALNREDALMLLPILLRKLWIYQVMLFIVTRDTLPIRNKFPGWEFYWSVDHGLFPRLGI